MTTITTVPVPTPSPGSSLGWALRDALVFSRRSIRHGLRNVDSLLMSVVLPVLILLLFVYVFGGAISSRADYVDYVVPGIIILTAGYGAAGTALSVCTDMTGGMMERLRTMPIAAWTALTGHVVASLARNLFSTTLVIAVALGIGFRPVGDPLAWLGAIGLVALWILVISWLAVAIGLVARSVEAADALGFVLLFVPYLSSAFVATDTMPAGVRAVADHQPITPLIETIRGLLLGAPVGSSWWIALAWCGGLLLVAVPLSARLFRHRAAR